MNKQENEQSQLAKSTARSRISSERWEQIKTAHASGIGLREIARYMRIPEGTVLARAKREGWTRQIQSAKALVKRQDAPFGVTPLEAVAMSMQQRGERSIERMAGVSERAIDHIETMDGPEILDTVDRIEKLDKVAPHLWHFRRKRGSEPNGSEHRHPQSVTGALGSRGQRAQSFAINLCNQRPALTKQAQKKAYNFSRLFVKIFGCKTAQSCATRCESQMIECLASATLCNATKRCAKTLS